MDVAPVVWSNENLIIIKDKKPAAKKHYLAISRRHIKNIDYLRVSDIELINEMKESAKMFIEKSICGFHIPPFTSVNHLHMHIL